MTDIWQEFITQINHTEQILTYNWLMRILLFSFPSVLFFISPFYFYLLLELIVKIGWISVYSRRNKMFLKFYAMYIQNNNALHSHMCFALDLFTYTVTFGSQKKTTLMKFRTGAWSITCVCHCFQSLLTFIFPIELQLLHVCWKALWDTS